MERKWMDVGSISGIASASAAVGGLLTRVAHVADDARKIDDPHLMCEKVIQFETCTFVYILFPPSYLFFLGRLSPAVWLGPPRIVLIGWSATRPLPLFVCLTCCGLRNARGKKKNKFSF
jgi:hypothetical protein